MKVSPPPSHKAPPNGTLVAALAFLRQAFLAHQALWHHPLADIPLQVIPDHQRHYLFKVGADGQKQLRHDRYEFFVYRLLRNRLEAGDAFCQASIRYRRRIKDRKIVDD